MNQIVHILQTWNHWAFLLQINVLGCIVLVLTQIRITAIYEHLRHCNHGLWGDVRRISLLGTLVALCWAVIYGYDRGWQPWPPFVAVMVTFNIHILARIIIMKQDVNRLRGETTSWHHLKDMA